MGFFDAFTGKAQAKDLANANAKAEGYVNQGYDQAGQAVDASHTAAQGYYQPYAESGNKANALYANAIGLNGADGYKAAAGAYQQNPFLEDQIARNENALMKGFNARGQTNSGAAALGAARAGQEARYNDYNSWLGRLQGEQSQGLQVAGAQAGQETQYGAQKSDLATGRAGTLAGNAINYGNAQAATRGIGINNLLNIAGTAAKAYAGFK